MVRLCLRVCVWTYVYHSHFVSIRLVALSVKFSSVHFCFHFKHIMKRAAEYVCINAAVYHFVTWIVYHLFVDMLERWVVVVVDKNFNVTKWMKNSLRKWRRVTSNRTLSVIVIRWLFEKIIHSVRFDFSSTLFPQYKWPIVGVWKSVCIEQPCHKNSNNNKNHLTTVK